MAAQVDNMAAAHAGTGMELVSVQQYESGPPISYLNRLVRRRLHCVQGRDILSRS